MNINCVLSDDLSFSFMQFVTQRNVFYQVKWLFYTFVKTVTNIVYFCDD